MLTRAVVRLITVLSSRLCPTRHHAVYLTDDIRLVSEGLRRRLHSFTDRSCADTHTTHSTTGTLLPLGHVCVTASQHTCVTGLLGNVSLGGLGAGRIAYWLEGCGLQNHTCGLFGLKPRCDNSAVNF